MSCSHSVKPASVPARTRDLLQARQVRGFRFTESVHEGLIPAHTHKHVTVNVLLQGTFEETYGLTSTYCEADSILYRPAEEVHTDQIGPHGAHNFVIEIEDECAESVGAYSNLLKEVAHLRDPGLMALVYQMRTEVKASDGASALALEGLVMTFIAQSIRVKSLPGRQSEQMNWLRRAEELLRDRFKENGIMMGELAAEVGVHPVHFARAFKVHFGTTPGRFLRTLRVEWAAEQLRITQQPVATIALEAGFSDQSHFGRVFKKHYKVTPATWRREHQ